MIPNKFFSKNGFRLKACLVVLMSLGMILNACKNITDNGELTVGKRGNLEKIVLPENPPQEVTFAASELQEYLELITGFRLPVVQQVNAEPDAKGIALILAEDDGIVWDGYKIAAGSEGIVISAKEPRGILYGVYQLLEEAGCLFVYPGKQEEVVPKVERVEFMPGERVFTPVVEHRGLTPYGLQGSSLETSRDFIDWMGKNKLNYILIAEDRKSDCPDSAHSSIWKEVAGELLSELQRRGFIIEMAEHTIDIFFPRSLFEEHPDWFALIKGKRRIGDDNDPYTGQMCYSNMEAVEYYASAVADYAARRPEFHIIGTWPRDGGQWCECDGCQKNPEVFLPAIERVAEKVKAVRPDISVEYMIYPRPLGFQPPPEKLPDNMSFLWIPDNGELDSLGRLWSQKSNREARGTYQFEYLMGDNYRSRTNVWLNPKLAVDNAKHAQFMEFRGVSSLFLPIQNWWRPAFNNWFFAKACWDTNLNIDSCLNIYSTRLYGDVASGTEAVFHEIINTMQSDQSIMIYNQNAENLLKYNEAVEVADNIIPKIDDMINSSDEPVVINRLLRLKAYVEYFKLFYEGLATGKEGSLLKLTAYSKEHPEYSMVLMSPDYINWRNSNIFK